MKLSLITSLVLSSLLTINAHAGLLDGLKINNKIENGKTKDVYSGVKFHYLDKEDRVQIVKEILKPLDYQNLDDLAVFEGQLTTTEFVAKYIFDEVTAKTAAFFKGKIAVSIKENPNAWAGFES